MRWARFKSICYVANPDGHLRSRALREDGRAGGRPGRVAPGAGEARRRGGGGDAPLRQHSSRRGGPDMGRHAALRRTQLFRRIHRSSGARGSALPLCRLSRTLRTRRCLRRRRGRLCRQSHPLRPAKPRRNRDWTQHLQAGYFPRARLACRFARSLPAGKRYRRQERYDDSQPGVSGKLSRERARRPRIEPRAVSPGRPGILGQRELSESRHCLVGRHHHGEPHLRERDPNR